MKKNIINLIIGIIIGLGIFWLFSSDGENINNTNIIGNINDCYKSIELSKECNEQIEEEMRSMEYGEYDPYENPDPCDLAPGSEENGC